MNEKAAGTFSLRNLLIAVGCICVASLGVHDVMLGPFPGFLHCRGIVLSIAGSYGAAGALVGQFRGAILVGTAVGMTVAALMALMASCLH